MFKDKLILISFSVAAILNIILWLVLLGKFGLAQSQIPLHFNVIAGIDLVGGSRQVYQLPAAGAVILLVNLVLSRIIYEYNRLWGYFFSVSAALMQILLAVSVVLLLKLNT